MVDYNMIDRKLVTFIGCSMVNFIAGTIYCTGSFMPYIASYIGLEKEYVSMKSLTIVFYICILTWSLSSLATSYILVRFSPKTPIYFGTILYIIVVFVTSALTDYIAIILVYGVLLGIGSGFTYLPATVIAINCYPHRRGIATGIVIGCFALGSCIFNLITLAIVNPHNERPDVVVEIDGVEEKFFCEKIANNVPKMFWILGGIYSVVIITGLLIIKDIENKPNTVKDRENKSENQDTTFNENTNREEIERRYKTFKQEIEVPSNDLVKDPGNSLEVCVETGIKIENESNEDIQKVPESSAPTHKLTYSQAFNTIQIYQVFFSTLFSGTAGMFAIASFKTIGIEYGYDDTFLTITGSIGSVMNGTNRPFWGYLIDKKSHRFAYMIICLLQIVVCFSFPSVNMYKPTFFIWFCVLYSCSGGTFTTLPLISLKMYGKEIAPGIYAFFITAMGFSSIFVYIIQVYVITYTGRNSFFYILGGLSTCSLISNILFREKLKS